MNRKLFTPLYLLFALFLSFSASAEKIIFFDTIPEIKLIDPQFSSDIIITAKMSGSNEVPAVTTDAVGVATVHFNEDFTLAIVNATVSNLSSAFTGAHIHEGKPGENGAVLLPLTNDYKNGRLTSEIAVVDSTLIAQLINGELYLNIHTENNPAGELRGNLKLEAPESFGGFLSGEEEVPALEVAGTGVVSIHYTPNTNVLEINALVDGLTGPITGAHLHMAAEGENGGVVEGLTDFLAGNAIKVKIQAGDYIEALRTGNIYLNIHTEANPSGELRAQIEPIDGIVIDTWLNSEQETADQLTVGENNALGLGLFQISASLDTLNYFVQLSNLTTFAAAAHLHNAPLGVTGDVVFNMSDDLFENLILGVDLPISKSLVKNILSGDIYLNVHTEANPDGEIRGQLYRLARDGYTYDICAQQEIPAPNGAANVSGSGMFAFNRDMNEAHLMVVVNELSSEFSGAHIHNAAMGETGGIIFPFTDNFANGGAFLYFTGDSETPFNADFADIIRKGNGYVNIHTSNNPAGEVRGQIIKTLACPLLSTSTIEVGKELVTFEVYPNPAKDQLTLSIPNMPGPVLDVLALSIFNNVGQKVKQLDNVSANQTISIGDLSTGMYYLTLSTAGVTSGMKFYKK